jgi:ABC-type multidrug transport system permease subunit
MKVIPGRSLRTSLRAFTLIEVMLAITIFFMAMFAILGVLSSGVHAATILRTSGPTAGMVAGQYFVTNQMEEGSDAGDFSDIAGYGGYVWQADKVEVDTNGLYKVHIEVYNSSHVAISILDVLLYKQGNGGNNRLGLQQQPH